MAVAFYAELPSMSTEKAEKVLQNLDLNGRSPAGQILHVEGPLASGGTWVFDIWESEPAAGTFFEKHLGPVMANLGITPPQPTMLSARVLLTPQELRHL